MKSALRFASCLSARLSRLCLPLSLAVVAARPLGAQTVLPPVFGGSGDELGFAVSGAGDVDADGYQDFVVGARYAGVGQPHVLVYSGLDSSLLFSVVDDSGPGTGGALGWSVSGIGDVNGDGYADLVAGAPAENVVRYQDGSAKVLSGRDGSVLFDFHGDRDNDRFGTSVAGAGDVNRDGIPDVVVGIESPLSRRGYARVFSGATGSVLYTFTESSPPDGSGVFGHFGASVSGAGDVNADGYADVIVGASLDDGNGRDSGSAFVFSGRDGSVLRVLRGDASLDYVGTSVGGAGDADGDGFGDLVVGAPGFDDPRPGGPPDAGLARVYSGSNGTILHSFVGDVEDRFFGMAVSGAGDVNGDGFSDVIAGSYGYPVTVASVDYAKVFSGRDGSELVAAYGGSLHDGWGRAVAAAGDCDGDGFADVIVGAHKDHTTGSRAGCAAVYMGRSDSGVVLAAPTPGIAGGVNTLQVTGAPVGSTVHFVYGRRLGQTPVPGCSGAVLSVLLPVLGPSAIAGTDGRASVEVSIPAAQVGRTFLLQAYVRGGCRVSNLVITTLR